MPTSTGVTILVVCEANRARSPAAARLLEAEALRRDRKLRIRSAGVNAYQRRGLLDTMEKAMASRGIDTTGHLARSLDIDEVLASSLVLTMTEEQRREVMRLDPAVVVRCFTLREVVRLVTSQRWSPEWNGRADVPRRLHEVRAWAAPPSKRPEDVIDPVIGGQRLARHVLTDIVTAVDAISTPLFGEPIV